MNSTATVADLEPARPFWIPPDVDFDSLPEELQLAITTIVGPAYRQLVLAAEPGLEQSTGLSVVNTLWLEILEQISLGADVQMSTADSGRSGERDKAIARYLRLAGAKIKSSNFLLRLHEFKQKWGSFPVAPDPLRAEKTDQQ